ncbi:hypothetical protein BO70DRAFT_51491 [Aspergillus heteromorphus CBS 117.55]|uniref:Uncharacterized protein n=1 Tax=Aspergillus heteromorphus CBS 117.55 TaxID=1448321 RepID=A0A317VZ31_9EURO|nr:uncharacterized protein BO70DRAFT_51491 [Aspergillus heteromorphus CBS 117.55]PWY79616.1 hypothetical protein BO70DRAFT_51491 [Aspergillus heteromorphus CBS 117.55]
MSHTSRPPPVVKSTSHPLPQACWLPRVSPREAPQRRYLPGTPATLRLEVSSVACRSFLQLNYVSMIVPVATTRADNGSAAHVVQASLPLGPRRSKLPRSLLHRLNPGGEVLFTS